MKEKPNIEDICIVCFYSLFYNTVNENKIGDYVLLPCGHSFHLNCLKKWFKYKKECPRCKESITQYINENNTNILL